MAWTRMLRYEAIVNNRLVMVETQNAAYYRFWIFPNAEKDFRNENKCTKSGFDFTSALAAFNAGKKFAKGWT